MGGGDDVRVGLGISPAPKDAEVTGKVHSVTSTESPNIRRPGAAGVRLHFDDVDLRTGKRQVISLCPMFS